MFPNVSEIITKILVRINKFSMEKNEKKVQINY